MKKTAAILMTIAILVQLHWRSGYLIDYYVNTDAYKALCINKDKPEMKCDGQCLLSRKLKEHDENQPALPLPHISFEFTFAVFFMTLRVISPKIAKGNTGYHNNYSYLALPDYITGVYDPSLSNMTIGARGVKWHRNTGDALMLGGEVRIKNQCFGTLKSELNAQYVYGQDADGEPLPQMPPLKISYTIDKEVGQWSFQPEFIWSSAQNRISSKFNERATDSFFLANLGISKNIKLPSGAFRMTLSMNNLFDVAYREHFDIGSILRPGRSIDVLLSWNLN